MNAMEIRRTHVANIAAVVTTLVALIALCAGCGRNSFPTLVSGASAQNTDSSKSREPVAVFTAKKGDLRRDVELSGTVEGYETANLMSKVDGYVGKVTVNIGDEVSAGDVLAELDAPEVLDEIERHRRLVEQAEAHVCSRRADVALAEARIGEYDAGLRMKQSERSRIARLVSRGSLTQQQLDEATFAVESNRAMRASAVANIAATKAQLDSAQAALNVAKADLRKSQSMARYGKIVAPFDGVVTERMIDSGAFVRPASTGSGTSMFTITRVDKVRIAAFLPMDEAGLLDVGDSIEIRSVQSLPDLNLSGVDLAVSRIARSFDKDSRMMRAEIDANNDEIQKASGKSLTPGDYVRLAVVLDALEGALVVPDAAVGNDDRGPFVAIVDSGNRCVRLPVKVLQRNTGMVAVESPDLREGATLLADAESVEDGTALTAQQMVREE